MSLVVIAVVLTALVFDFTNGFHDTANAMATSIATGALRPRTAVLLAGVLNLVGACGCPKLCTQPLTWTPRPSTRSRPAPAPGPPGRARRLDPRALAD